MANNQGKTVWEIHYRDPKTYVMKIKTIHAKDIQEVREKARKMAESDIYTAIELKADHKQHQIEIKESLK